MEYPRPLPISLPLSFLPISLSPPFSLSLPSFPLPLLCAPPPPPKTGLDTGGLHGDAVESWERQFHLQRGGGSLRHALSGRPRQRLQVLYQNETNGSCTYMYTTHPHPCILSGKLAMDSNMCIECKMLCQCIQVAWTELYIGILTYAMDAHIVAILLCASPCLVDNEN